MTWYRSLFAKNGNHKKIDNYACHNLELGYNFYFEKLFVLSWV